MKGQSSLVTTIVLIAFALILGTTMVVYFTSFLNNYRTQTDLLNTLSYEASNTILRYVTVDTVNKQLWIVLKRLDNVKKPFFISVGLSSGVNAWYVQCSSIRIYNYSRDVDGILCSNDGDCTQASAVAIASSVYALTSDGVVPYRVYASRFGYISTPPQQGSVCRVDSYEPSPTIVSIPIGSAVKVYIHVVSVVNNVPYIVYTYVFNIG